MNQISIVIIAKNEAANIGDCIISARLVSNDIIVADSGSEDGTQKLVLKYGARLHETTWKGYGQTRNEATAIAVNKWILALDADERLSPELATAIKGCALNDGKILYGFKRKSFLARKKIRFGEWGRDRVYRLYNKDQAAWDAQLVHENITGNGIVKKLILGELLHYTMKNMKEYQAKTILYANLSAQKYADRGKKAFWIKRYISPVFGFIQNYIFRLGFLDGKEGLIIAYTSAKYVYLKYKFLHLINEGKPIL